MMKKFAAYGGKTGENPLYPFLIETMEAMFYV